MPPMGGVWGKWEMKPGGFSDRSCCKEARVVHLPPTSCQVGTENQRDAAEHDSALTEMLAHTEQQEHLLNPKLPSQTK